MCFFALLGSIWRHANLCDVYIVIVFGNLVSAYLSQDLPYPSIMKAWAVKQN